VRNIRVGDAVVSLRFVRQSDGSATHEVLEQTGRLHTLTVPPNDGGDSDGSWMDSLKARLLRHAPGRKAREVRLALGQMDGDLSPD
jgi:hypothetical protein